MSPILGGGVGSVTCGVPVKSLERGGVVAGWFSRAGTWTPAQVAADLEQSPGERITVDGQPGKVLVSADIGRNCSGLHATRVMTATFLVDGRFTYRMVACMRGPGFVAREAQLRSMLQRTRF